MLYRADIDGLRAIAVVTVVLFHAGLDSFGGGYVGVDVFFVISGYLITGIIVEDLEKGDFKLLHFYERRVRRILPALLALIFFCFPFALLWLVPSDVRAFSQSVAAAVAFISNFYFWKQSGYFNHGAEFEPLLHTWSLAVEEQYYAIFPLLLLLAWKLGRGRVVFILISISVVSMSLAIWSPYGGSEAKFFLLPTRVWELLLGALSYFCVDRIRDSRYLARELLSLLGLALILFAVFTYDSTTPAPSEYTLIPTFGAALLILFSVKGTVSHTILSHKYFVGIGLTSYSIYLWHQPIFVFSRHSPWADRYNEMLPFLIGLSFLCGWLSWKYVESPFRRAGSFPGFSGKRKALLLVSASFLLFLTGIYGGLGGFDSLYDDAETAILTTLERSSTPICSNAVTFCNEGDFKREDILLLGDSNAYHFSSALQDAAYSQGGKLFNVTLGGCLPLAKFYRLNQSREFNEGCHVFNTQLLHTIDSGKFFPGTVVVSAAWLLYLRGENFYSDVDELGDRKINDMILSLDGKKALDEDIEEEFFRYLDFMLTTLSDYSNSLVVVGPIPPSLTNFKSRAALLPQGQASRVSDFEENADGLIRHLELARDELGFKLLLPHEALCDQEYCRTFDKGGHLYGDPTHFSRYGQEKIMSPLFNF